MVFFFLEKVKIREPWYKKKWSLLTSWALWCSLPTIMEWARKEKKRLVHKQFIFFQSKNMNKNLDASYTIHSPCWFSIDGNTTLPWNYSEVIVVLLHSVLLVGYPSHYLFRTYKISKNCEKCKPFWLKFFGYFELCFCFSEI